MKNDPLMAHLSVRICPFQGANRICSDTRKRHHEETTRDAELERLRREGAEMLRKVREAEERRVREEHAATQKANHASTSTGPSRSATLKAKWKAVPGSKFNYTSDDLHRIFCKF